MNTRYITLFLLAAGLQLNAQDWSITPEEKEMKMTISFDEANQTAGKGVYDKFCKVCHAEATSIAANDRKLPLAPNLGAKDIQARSNDGEMFAKLSKGKGGMPPFGAVLSDEDRWKVISYIRSLDPAYVPSTASGDVSAAAEKFEGTIKAITISYDTAQKQMIAQLTAVDLAGNPTFAKNVKIDFLVKRSFGMLPIAQGVKTNDKGQAILTDANFKADTSGFVTVVAQTSDKAVSVEAQLQTRKAWIYHNPLDKRELWGTSANTPLWLLITYVTVVLGVLATIGWTILQLFRIWMLRER
jgi:mono/diheme cytochrome c family protein